MESVTQTSLALTAALDVAEEPKAEEVVTAKHQAIVLEKLVMEQREEEEIPTEM